LFFVFNFVCCFACYCSGFGELVLVVERNSYYLVDNLYGECESWFLETIGVELSKEQRDVDKKKSYEAG
jgi:hypothetical protein